MKWFIRRVIKKGKGTLQYEEEIHFGETLTVGRAANQAIFVNDLRAALEHARVVALGKGRYRIESLVGSGLRIDGRFEQTATGSAGTSIEIGNTRITLIDPPPEFEAAVEVALVDKSEVAARETAEALPQSLAEAGLGKRGPAWALLLIALALGLLLPIAAHYVPTFRSMTKEVPMVGLNAWDSGPLAAAHHTMARDCQACHGEPFQVVQDAKCVECHGQTKAHADPERFPLYEVANARCAHCHRDHNGPHGLVWRDQVLCSDCHQNLGERVGGDTLVADVRDFGNAHPQFKILLPAWTEDGGFAPKRVSMDEMPLVEASGLKFPHATHLREQGLQSPGGTRTLVCADCHVEEAGGLLMQAIDFGKHCQDCHRLDFDLRMPDRQVPHAQVAEVQYMLSDFYSRIALEGGYDDVRAPITVRERRRPGQPPMSQQEQREALEWARSKAQEVTDTLFGGRACGVCHTVSKDSSAPLGGWTVAPVRVAGVWFEKSRFSHRKHTTMQCEDCHAASRSMHSADVLIPDIGDGSFQTEAPYACRHCHAGAEGEKGKLSSTCIACHGFHQADFPMHSVLNKEG